MTILKPAPEGKLPPIGSIFKKGSDDTYGIYEGKLRLLAYSEESNSWYYYNMFFKEWLKCSSTVIWYESVEVPDELLKDY